MSDKIIITIPEGTVMYQDWDNKWRADREGAVVATRGSLNEAKQALVDLVKRENSKDSPFKRHKAYSCRYHQNPELVTVTSYVDQHEAWVVNDKDGRRSKVRLDDLKAWHPRNEAHVHDMAQLDKEIEDLQKKRSSIAKVLDPYKKNPLG